MTPRIFRAWLLAVVASASLSAFAQNPPPAPAPAAPTTARVVNNWDEPAAPLKLADAPLDLILPLLEKLTDRTILRPQALPTAQFTFTIKEGMTKGDALRTIQTALNLNGIAVVYMGDKFLKVVPLQNARIESPQFIEGSTLDLPPSGQIATKLFQLQFLRVEEFIPTLGMMLNQNISTPVIFAKSNAALITDSIGTLQRVELLIQKLDQPLMSNLTPKFYSIHFAKASDIVTRIRTMLQGQLQNQIGSANSITPDDRTNQVVLICDPRQQVFFDELVSKLDVKSDPNTRNEVIYLKHATSKDVASLLGNLVSGQTKAAQSNGSVQPGMIQPNQAAQPNQVAQTTPNIPSALGDLGSSQFSSLLTINSDDRSNAIVVNGTMDDIRLIKDLVDKIDIVLAQVRIEVVIAEVSLTDASSTGISALGLDVAGNKLMGISATVPGATIANNSSSAGYYGTSDSPAHGGYYALSSNVAATAGHFSLVGLVSLSTTPRKSDSRIISTPTITTTHNREAKFFFGETRPVISGITSSPTSTSSSTTTSTMSTSSSVTQQEIGTTLTVKPLIGNDGSVQLDIKQTISDVQDTVTIDGNTQYVIGKRETDSFVTIKSNEIIVLAGIQKDNYTHSTTRLGPIPWIGDLLGSRSRSKTRTELVIFIRPTVLTNTPADNVEALKIIDSMSDGSEVHKTLDPNYETKPTPFYKKKLEIP